VGAFDLYLIGRLIGRIERVVLDRRCRDDAAREQVKDMRCADDPSVVCGSCCDGDQHLVDAQCAPYERLPGVTRNDNRAGIADGKDVIARCEATRHMSQCDVGPG
jgi:hypothetical protein